MNRHWAGTKGQRFLAPKPSTGASSNAGVLPPPRAHLLFARTRALDRVRKGLDFGHYRRLWLAHLGGDCVVAQVQLGSWRTSTCCSSQAPERTSGIQFVDGSGDVTGLRAENTEIPSPTDGSR